MCGHVVGCDGCSVTRYNRSVIHVDRTHDSMASSLCELLITGVTWHKCGRPRVYRIADVVHHIVIHCNTMGILLCGCHCGCIDVYCGGDMWLC